MRLKTGRRLFKWFFHWLTALLVAAALLTSLLPVGFGSRAAWLSLHISLGWSIVALLAIRSALWAKGRFLPAAKLTTRFGLRQWARYNLVSGLCSCLLLGVLAYRPSPLMANIKVFGFLQAPVFEVLSHSAHLWVIQWHQYLAYDVLFGLLIHGAFAFIPMQQYGSMPVAWLWNSRSRGGARNH